MKMLLQELQSIMYCIVSVLILSLTYARNCRMVTEKCPVGEMNWKSRALQFNCLNESGRYTCLKDYKNNLVETCDGTITIKKGVVGCPYVLICTNNTVLIASDKDFHHCPTNKIGCPPQNHIGYALHELYKYPACSVLDSMTEEKEVYTDTESSPSNIPWMPIVIPLICIVIVASVAFGIFCLRRKEVRFPCCRTTCQSEDMELGTGKSSNTDGDVTNEKIGDKELRDKTILSGIEQFGNEMKEAIESRDSGRIMENLNKWKREPLNIGIAGTVMSGKSSFINVMLGASKNDKAKIGIGNTTTAPRSYPHPKDNGLWFWDLPGYNTPKFKLNDKYFRDIKVEQYDFFLIFFSTVISEADIVFARRLLQIEKKFVFVRTKADEFISSKMKEKKFHQWLALVKEECRSTLEMEGITEEVQIFVISNTKPSLGDFDNMINFLTEITPEIKRMHIFVMFKRQTSEMIDKMESQLLDRAWKAAVAMGVSTALPIPGIDIAFNMALLEEEITFYLKTFQLDEVSLKEYPKHTIEQLKTCHEMMTVGKIDFIINGIGKMAVLSAVGNVFEYAIPILGGIVNGTTSTYRMYNFLKTMIANLAEDARTLLKLQAEEII